ncbi:hypothetical protein J6590_107226 [Homalodisca vitripennis]|nr:hypothetical protein J6590_107226 [Homalodisca vitripennis]
MHRIPGDLRLVRSLERSGGEIWFIACNGITWVTPEPLLARPLPCIAFIPAAGAHSAVPSRPSGSRPIVLSHAPSPDSAIKVEATSSSICIEDFLPADEVCCKGVMSHRVTGAPLIAAVVIYRKR